MKIKFNNINHWIEFKINNKKALILYKIKNLICIRHKVFFKKSKAFKILLKCLICNLMKNKEKI
jgi:hypothetical protein